MDIPKITELSDSNDPTQDSQPQQHAIEYSKSKEDE